MQKEKKKDGGPVGGSGRRLVWGGKMGVGGLNGCEPRIEFIVKRA